MTTVGSFGIRQTLKKSHVLILVMSSHVLWFCMAYSTTLKSHNTSSYLLSVFLFFQLQLLFIKPVVQGNVDDSFKKYPASQLSFVDPEFLPNQNSLKPDEKPNFLVFLADDLGYGDLAIYGHPTQPIGPLDELAQKGMRFTQLYADAVCSTSRSQFLTGRLGVRTGVTGGKRYLGFFDSGGLPDSEITIPELLQTAGYTTGMNGKWHLGINCKNHSDGCHLPFHHGFDFVGTYFPTSHNPNCDYTGRYVAEPKCRCMLYQGRGTTPWQTSAYVENITDLLLTEAKNFITTNQDQPWFFMFASPQVHQPVYSSANFKGATIRGPYGDAAAEMSWGAGQLVSHLAKLKLMQKTLFLFFSDNGALFYDVVDAGCNGLLRGTKASSWEGGYRVPGFAWWTGQIPPSTISYDVLSSADFLPTIASLAGISPSNDTILDGVDISSVLFGTPQSNLSIERPIYHYCNRKLMAVRYGAFKFHYWTFKDFPGLSDGDIYSKYHPRSDVTDQRHWMMNCSDARMEKHEPPLLYNLNSDASEAYPLIIGEYPGLLETVENVVANHKSNLDLSIEEQLGSTDKNLHPLCTNNVKN